MSTINFPLTTTSLFVNTLNTNKIIYLPAASTVNAGRLFYIKDICGNAARSSIYISTTGMDRIENRFQPSTLYALMSTNYGSVLMAPDGALNWYFLQHYYKNAVSSLGATVVLNGIVTATGGTITTNGSYKIHTFTASGSFTLTSPGSITAQVLVVGGGGGGGGYYNGGGGGAGGAVYSSAFTIASGSYTVTIGGGGSGQSGYASAGTSGSSSTFSTLTGNGGGAGGSDNNVNGVSGGCGGGMGPLGATAPGSGTQGYAGGYGTNGANMGNLGGAYGSGYGGGGGGGMGSVGSNALTSAGPGWGGTGATYSVGGTNYLVCGGGGAGTADTDNTNFGLGGSSIGGVGGLNAVRGAGNGAANTGSGGGGYGRNGAGSAGGTGGSGIVIIAYTTSSVAFTPASITALSLWLDGADSTTITTVTGVSQWNDKSGNAYNLTQSTTSLQPTRTGNYLNFQSNYYLNVPFSAMNNFSTWSIFLLINPISASNWIMVKQKDGANTYNVISMTYNTSGGGGPQTGTSGYLYWRSYNSGAQAASANALSTSTVQIFNIIYDGTNLYIYINGTLNSTTAGAFAIQNDTSPSNYTLGCWIQSSSVINTGVTSFQLGEMLSYSTNLSATNRQTLEGYLAWKWGIQSSLPSGHPYLTAAPTSAIGTPIATGLRYQFDAAKNLPTTSGWTDANGYGNLTFYNSPPVTTGSVNYVSFNGTSQYGASVDMTNLAAFTITMWIRTTSTTNNSTYYLKPHLIGEGSGGNASRDFGLTIGGGYAGIWSGIGSTDTQNQSETNTSAANYIANGLWHELTVTSSYTNGSRLYVNSTQFGSALGVSQNTESGQNWFIAATNYLAGGPNCWAALDLSVVLLYTRELSSTEVTANYNSYRSRFGR